MSGAEAFAVLGIISSIITIIETTQKIFDAVQDSSGLHNSFRKIAEGIPIVLRTLRKIEDIQEGAIQDSRSAQDVQTMREIAETASFVSPILLACKRTAQELQLFFEKYLPVAGASRAARLTKAVRSVAPGRKKKAELMFKDILDKMQLLANHQMFENAATSTEISTTLHKFYYEGSRAGENPPSELAQRSMPPSAFVEKGGDCIGLVPRRELRESDQQALLDTLGHKFTYNNSDATKIANQGAVVVHGGQAITL